MATHSKSRVDAAICKATKLLGYAELRPKQELVVKRFLQGKDVFVILPTGSGKSLCYCMLPAVFDELRKVPNSSVVVVVSPLISLMKDQVRAMTARNVSAVYAGDQEADEQTVHDICEGRYQLVYMSPESLLKDMRWRDMLQSPIYQSNLVALVIDEAHCVTKWGETFREEFLHLGEVRSLIPENVRMMALTATATKSTRQAVCRLLGMVHAVAVSEPPNRPNIKYIVSANPGELEETFEPLVEDIRKFRIYAEKVIVFCRTYDSFGRIYMYIKSRLGKESTEPIGAPDLARFRLVDMFSACTHPKVKNEILDSFSNPTSHLRVVIGTVAFGMGLDCPNVRKIIHWGPSGDIEAYVQETGRAGRDGLPAQAILYYSNSNLQNVASEMKEYCKNTDACRRWSLLKEFDGSEEVTYSRTLCQCCDVCQQKCKCSLCAS